MTHCPFFQDFIYDDPLPLLLVRNVSDDYAFPGFFATVKTQTIEPQDIKFEPLMKNEMVTLEEQPIIPNFCQYRKPRVRNDKPTSTQRRDYKKNICGYITKKIVRQFMSQTYKQKVQRLCLKYKCDYDEIMDYYDKKIERITGPTHLDMLLNGSKDQPEMKKCFKSFFIWFLRHRYIRYLICEGKMDNKEAYIDYKNKTLLYLGSMDDRIQSNWEGFGEFQSK